MSRVCTVCSCPDRPAIDAAIVAGTPYRDIALRFSLGLMAIQRHATKHISETVARSQEAREEAQALDVVKQLKAINGAAMAILRDARAAGDPDTQLKAIDRIQRQIELQAKLLGDLDERPQVNVLVMPEWLAIRTALLQALAPYSEARAAVAQTLLTLEAQHDVVA